MEGYHLGLLLSRHATHGLNNVTNYLYYFGSNTYIDTAALTLVVVVIKNCKDMR